MWTKVALISQTKAYLCPPSTTIKDVCHCTWLIFCIFGGGGSFLRQGLPLVLADLVLPL